MRFHGFEPFANANSRVLILGSFPSIKSREDGFFYGNKQNRFWRLLCEAFDEELPTSIVDKQQLLVRHNIALWDVVTSCEIHGSLDINIKDYEVANLYNLVKQSKINYIITNGKVAGEIYHMHYGRLCIPHICLPSTSPANTRCDTELWIRTLRD